MRRHPTVIEAPSQTVIQKRLQSAVERLLREDADLLRLNINERTITHRLAMYLRDEFRDWDVDCEYNRNHDQIKKLQFPPGKCRPDDTDAKTVFPDVIVHKRESDQNLLVIELKKDSNPGGDEYDAKKLQAFRYELGYRSAAFVKLRTGVNPGAEPIRWI